MIILAYDNVIAAGLGGLASAMRYHRSGWIVCLQVFIAGVSLSLFAGDDVSGLIVKYSGWVVSYALIYFLLAYLGPTILDRATMLIKTLQVTKKWK